MPPADSEGLRPGTFVASCFIVPPFVVPSFRARRISLLLNVSYTTAKPAQRRAHLGTPSSRSRRDDGASMTLRDFANAACRRQRFWSAAALFRFPVPECATDWAVNDHWHVKAVIPELSKMKM